jgi:serine/threonine-protein kinase PknG
MAVGDDVKLIDLGAVMRATDATAAVFGTQGFQAPEVAADGPSVASDVYTVGRTIAVLILNFVYHEGAFQYALPGQQDEPIFAAWESLYRLLLKCTATAPSDRFDSIDELADQLHGVLREIVARTDKRPRPATSTRFSSDQLASLFADLGDALDVAAPTWRALPTPLVDVADPAAAMLMGLSAFDAATSRTVLAAAIDEHRVEPSREVDLRLVRAMVDDRGTGGTSTPESIQAKLGELERADPWDWRVDWYRGTDALAADGAIAAADYFSRVWTDLPGELAPKMAVALAAEQAGDAARAAELYDIVLTVDDSWVSAAFGLARSRRALGQFDEAVSALERVPTTSALYIDAQIAVARARVGPDTAVDATDIEVAAAIISRLLLDARTRAQMQVEVFERVLHALPAAAPGAMPSTLFGTPVEERAVRKALERGYRDLARSSATKAERYEYVDKANRVRPRTFA